MTHEIFLPVGQDKIDQYRSKTRAIRQAKRETKNTGQKHSARLTTCYRVLADNTIESYACWAVVLDR